MLDFSYNWHVGDPCSKSCQANSEKLSVWAQPYWHAPGNENNGKDEISIAHVNFLPTICKTLCLESVNLTMTG